LLRLVLTLSISTATVERIFPGMKVMKTRLGTTMGDGFARDCLVIYIRRHWLKRLVMTISLMNMILPILVELSLN